MQKYSDLSNLSSQPYHHHRQTYHPDFPIQINNPTDVAFYSAHLAAHGADHAVAKALAAENKAREALKVYSDAHLDALIAINAANAAAFSAEGVNMPVNSSEAELNEYLVALSSGKSAAISKGALATTPAVVPIEEKITPSVSRAFSTQQIDILKKLLMKTNCPSMKEREEVASKTNLSIRQVSKWFAMKRYNAKKAEKEEKKAEKTIKKERVGVKKEELLD